MTVASPSKKKSPHAAMNNILQLTAAFLMLAAAASPTLAEDRSAASYRPDVTFDLRTDIADGKMVFVGTRGAIKDQINPDLVVPADAVVQINLVNGDGAVHDIALPDLNAHSDKVSGKGASTAIVFRVDEEGEFNYICTLPGHVQAGMIGTLRVGEVAAAAETDAVQVAASPMEVGEPVADREPRTLNVELETTEVIGRLDDGSTYRFWTFNDQVPGPFIRARVGDTINVSLTNAEDSVHIHSVDLHAVTGPGGGAEATQVPPGESRGFSFKALSPGLYVYHCATPMVAQHITNGMYGLILVEPEGGLPEVDREFYVMQGELYTNESHGTAGEHEFSLERLLDERPSHLTFNGAMGALTKTHEMNAETGETVRIFFGVGGPNLTSSFHVIGEIFDRVYNQGDLTSAPMKNVQTTTVAPGGATMVEFTTEVPGRYILVDHALSRLEKGLVGFLSVEGPDNPEVFEADD